MLVHHSLMSIGDRFWDPCRYQNPWMLKSFVYNDTEQLVLGNPWFLIHRHGEMTVYVIFKVKFNIMTDMKKLHFVFVAFAIFIYPSMHVWVLCLCHHFPFPNPIWLLDLVLVIDIPSQIFEAVSVLRLSSLCFTFPPLWDNPLPEMIYRLVLWLSTPFTCRKMTKSRRKSPVTQSSTFPPSAKSMETGNCKVGLSSLLLLMRCFFTMLLHPWSSCKIKLNFIHFSNHW